MANIEALSLTGYGLYGWQPAWAWAGFGLACVRLRQAGGLAGIADNDKLCRH